MHFHKEWTPEEYQIKAICESETYRKKAAEYNVEDKMGVITGLVLRKYREGTPFEELEPEIDRIIMDLGEKKAESLRNQYDKDKHNHEKSYNRFLFNETQDDLTILESIDKDMSDLHNTESGTGWMRLGTLLSMNTTEQMIGAGFKSLMVENKILIKQNEILRRQNEKIIELLEKK